MNETLGIRYKFKYGELFKKVQFVNTLIGLIIQTAVNYINPARLNQTS